MKVHYGEGVANRIGPEPCAGSREGAGEASVGECTGQPLSRERVVSGADTVTWVSEACHHVSSTIPQLQRAQFLVPVSQEI